MGTACLHWFMLGFSKKNKHKNAVKFTKQNFEIMKYRFNSLCVKVTTYIHICYESCKLFQTHTHIHICGFSLYTVYLKNVVFVCDSEIHCGPY